MSFKKTLFFISAFSPLWVIFILNYSLKENVDWLVVVGLSSLLLTINVGIILQLKKSNHNKIDLSYFKIVKKSDISHSVSFYILAYIPLLLIQDSTSSNIATFGVLLATIFILYVKLNLLHINPIISLFYNTYRVTDEYDNTVVIFSKLKVKNNTNIAYQEIASNLFINVE